MQAAFTPASRCRACSITKQFVALLLLQLQEAGRLSLEDSTGKYIPALAGFDPALLQTRIFALLGMTDSHLGEDSGRELADRTTGYRRIDGSWECETTRIVWSGTAALGPSARLAHGTDALFR